MTDAEDLEYIRHSWGSVYRVNVLNGKWQAIALFGSHDVLAAEDAEELLCKIRKRYPGLTDRPAAPDQ